MTIPREIEGAFIPIDDSRNYGNYYNHQQQQVPLMSAEEAAILELYEDIDGIWDYNDEHSFCPSSSSDGSSIDSNEDDDDDESDDEGDLRGRFMLDIDFPRRPQRPANNDNNSNRENYRRLSRSRLQHLRRAVTEYQIEFYGGEIFDDENNNMNPTYDEDSVVLTTRRGVRRHSNHHHNQQQQQSEQQEQEVQGQQEPAPQDESISDPVRRCSGIISIMPLK